jgi:F-type H+-transporting ATPase subunit gamma
MPSSQNLKKRIRLVKNIAKVTKAMQVAASLKMKKSQETALASRFFSQKLSHIASLVVGEAVTVTNSKIDLVLVAPDRGLCGSLLSTIEKGLKKWIDSVGQENVRVFCINRKATIVARHLNLDIIGVFDISVAKPDQTKMGAVIQMLTDDLKQGLVGRCLVGYAQFENLMSQNFTTTQILPFQPDSSLTDVGDFLIEPNKVEVYDNLVPRSMRLKLYQTILETAASEFSARAMAMKSASDNASDISVFLTSEYNKHRQASITAQIAEVIGAGLSSES